MIIHSFVILSTVSLSVAFSCSCFITQQQQQQQQQQQSQLSSAYKFCEKRITSGKSCSRTNKKCRNLSWGPFLATTQESSVDIELSVRRSGSNYESDSSLDSTKYNQLMVWLKAMDGSYIHDSIVLKPSERGGGFGAFVIDTTKPLDVMDEPSDPQPLIQKDELLFRIPRSACITLADALSDNECGSGFQQLIEKAGPGGNTVALAGYMASEWLKCIETSENYDLEKSKYGPYLATLPWARGVNSQDHILYWDDERIESILAGSLCYQEAKDLRNEVKVATKVLNSIIGRARNKKKQTEEGFRWPWEKKSNDRESSSGNGSVVVPGLTIAITGAFVSVLTRAFEDRWDNSDDDAEKMVPLLDMLQHSDEPNVSHAMRKSNDGDGSIEVRAKIPLYNGNELWNQYRSELEETMPYHRFFTRFGFVPGIINEPMENLFADRSSIFFAQQAEV